MSKRIAKPGEFPKYVFSPTLGQRLLNNMAEEEALFRGKHDWQYTPVIGAPAPVEERAANREPEHLFGDQNLIELKQNYLDLQAKYETLFERHGRLVDAGSAPADQQLIVEHAGLKRAHAALEVNYGGVVGKLEALKEEHAAVCEERDELLKGKEEALAKELDAQLSLAEQG